MATCPETSWGEQDADSESLDALDTPIFSQSERDAMVLQFLPMARSMARKAALKSHLDFEDLCQDAILGLIYAANRFDPSRGVQFSTYASYWVAERMQMAAIKSMVVHVPTHLAKASHARQKRADREAALSSPVLSETVEVAANGDAPEDAPKSSRKGKKSSAKQRKTRLEAYHPVQRVDLYGTGEDAPHDPFDRMSAESDGPEDWERVVFSLMDLSRLRSAMRELPVQQRKVLCLYHGLEGCDTHTMEEIGSQMRCSREYVRQILGKAMEFLRKRLMDKGEPHGV